MNGQQFDFFMGKSGDGYIGRVKCPCCGNHSQVRAKVVAEGAKKFFAGTVEAPPAEKPRKNQQVDAFKAFKEMEGK